MRCVIDFPWFGVAVDDRRPCRCPPPPCGERDSRPACATASCADDSGKPDMREGRDVSDHRHGHGRSSVCRGTAVAQALVGPRFPARSHQPGKVVRVHTAGVIVRMLALIVLLAPYRPHAGLPRGVARDRDPSPMLVVPRAEQPCSVRTSVWPLRGKVIFTSGAARPAGSRSSSAAANPHPAAPTPPGDGRGDARARQRPTVRPRRRSPRWWLDRIVEDRGRWLRAAGYARNCMVVIWGCVSWSADVGESFVRFAAVPFGVRKVDDAGPRATPELEAT